jgi:type I restriction-modification system DNA methylase subunit
MEDSLILIERRKNVISSIDYFLNLFTIRGITSREQLLNEMLRVKLTAKAMKSQKKSIQDEDQLFELMKQSTENTILGYFPGDRDFFSTVYKVAHNVDLIEFTLKLYQNDRFGQIFSPVYLTEYICRLADEAKAQTILITEAEKSLLGLKNFVDKHKSSNITFTTSSALMFMMLKLGFEGYKNVSILNQSIYQELLIGTRFDFIYSLPDFSGKIESLNDKFMSSRPDIIATQNLLGQLSEKGTLVTVLPARITFSSGSEAKLREHIMTNYQLEDIYSLPEGTFRPYTSIKTYMLRIGVVKKESVNVGYLGYDNGLYIDKAKVVGSKEFSNHEDWRIELILEDDDENIKKYKSSTLERVKLHEVAEVFRGKSILKKDVKPGNIKVLNISNITDTGIDYSEMDSIEEEERKIKRYELMDGDIVLSCRGTAIKTGVFRKQKGIVIASANVIVIRPNHRILSDYLRIFFESPVGIALIKSFQRGTTVVNINHMDIAEMEIPLLSMEEQKELVTHYEKESSLYRETVSRAEERFTAEKQKIYEKLL